MSVSNAVRRVESPDDWAYHQSNDEGVAPEHLMRSKTNVVAWVVAVIIIIVIIVGGWFWWHHEHAPARQAPSTALSATAPPATVPAIRHPIAQAASTPAAASSTPLPALDQSDSAVVAALARLTGDASIGKQLVSAHIIPRLVATIDSLPRHEIGSNILPLRPPAGSFATRTTNGQLVLSPSNYARYAPYVAWVRHANVQQLVAWYVRYYPLFQQAYRKLGFPHGYFNDRLVAVIDNLLKAPEPQGPVALVKTATGYAYADPQLQALSVGQQLMLRMGTANEKLVKQKLRAIRAAVTGEHGPASAASAATASSAR